MKHSVLPWYGGGLFLAVAFLSAVFLVKPIGVSTQFVIADGLLWKVIQNDIVVEDPSTKSGYASPNAYLNKSGGKYAAAIANPLNYGYVFVLAMMGGAFLSSRLKGDRPDSPNHTIMPHVWRQRFGDCPIRRYMWSFLAGFLVLFGARLAGGCTSGHMMSGMMQTALSGYLFSLGAFATSIPLAVFLYRGRASS